MATGESYASTTAGNEIFYEWGCQTCEENDCITEAVAYCRDCKECYCGSCLRDHNKFVSLRGHSVLGETNKNDWGKSKISPVVSKDSGIECSEHKGQSISMYCGNHDAVCCPVCAFMKHGEVCKSNMSYIPNVAQGIGSSSDLKDLMTTNEQLLLRIEQIETKKSEGLASVSTSGKKCRKKVSDICQKYLARIKELERISITNVNKKHDDEEKNIQRDIDQCAEERLQLQGVKQQMQATHPINDSALFIKLKAGQKCHQRCKEVCESLSSRQMKTFEFHEDTDTLQASLPKSLGECREHTPKKMMENNIQAGYSGQNTHSDISSRTAGTRSTFSSSSSSSSSDISGSEGGQDASRNIPLPVSTMAQDTTDGAYKQNMPDKKPVFVILKKLNKFMIKHVESGIIGLLSKEIKPGSNMSIDENFLQDDTGNIFEITYANSTFEYKKIESACVVMQSNKRDNVG